MDYLDFLDDFLGQSEIREKLCSYSFQLKNDDLLKKCGFSKFDYCRLHKKFEKILSEHIEDYLDFTIKEEESVLEKFQYK